MLLARSMPAVTQAACHDISWRARLAVASKLPVLSDGVAAMGCRAGIRRSGCMASTLDHIEKTPADSYRREIEQEQNLWRSLPFFAATLVSELAAMSAQ